MTVHTGAGVQREGTRDGTSRGLEVVRAPGALVVRDKVGPEPFRLVRAGGLDVSEPLAALVAGLDPGAVIDRGDDFLGLDVELTDGLPVVPHPELARRWTERHLDDVVVDVADAVATDVTAAREAGGREVDVADPRCAEHEEALDFSAPENVDRNFFYLADPLHRRRVRMLADVVAVQVEAVVAARGSATVLEVGPGLSSVARCAIERLDPTVRSRVEFAAVDVSEDLLRYGVRRGWLDRGVVADLATLDPSVLDDLLGRPDVLVMAEVLEHIAGSAAVFARTLLPWLRRSGSWLVGSVPNSVQGAELLGMAGGRRAPHQLSRHLVDESTGHVAFYTYATLRDALQRVWDLGDPHVWSNGVRLDPRGEAVCYDAGLRFPHRGDRLCFAGRC